VSQLIPIIYAPRLGPARVSFWGRLLALAIALACLAVLVTAALIPPSPAGIGSHEHLRLEPCQFLAKTGLPCPSCGMTTSFAWFVRGNLLASFYVQPMGMILAVLCCCAIWSGFYIAITGRSAHRMARNLNWTPIVVTGIALWLAAWGWKIWIHLHGIDGWW